MTDQLTAPAFGPPVVEAVAQPTGAVASAHRYPGSPPFGDSELDRLLFRGRDAECDEVLHSILSYDLFLIYAVSGLGKTSMVTAGVLERLRGRGYFPAIVRLNDPDSSPVTLIEAQICEAGAQDEGVDITRSPTLGGTAAEPATLWDLLSGIEVWRDNTLQQLVVIFDQFEELFTLGWTDEARDRFIEEFGEVVRRHRSAQPDETDEARPLPPPRVKFVLIMREDFIGQLEALAVHVPQIMHRRFRLEGLSPEQAEAAVCEPAQIADARLTQPFTYSQGAAEAILTFLRTKEERGKQVLTRSIDPSQLQIVCQHVERTILPRKSASPGAVVEIDESDLGGREGLERIVGDFYRRVIESFPRQQRKTLTEFCEKGLISDSGRRLSLEEGEIAAHFGVSKETLAELVDRRLLRCEPRVGSVYYELAHDTLAAPILAYRGARKRTRRRRWMIGLLAVAVLAAAALLVFLVSRSSGDDATPRVQSFDVGEVVESSLGSTGVAVFEFDTVNDRPLLVEIVPQSPMAVAVDVARAADDQSGEPPGAATRRAAGATATAVVAGEPATYRATVQGSPGGAITLTVRSINAQDVVLPGDHHEAAALAADQLKVYEVEIGDERPFIVSTTPTDQLDAVLEVIDPRGRATTADSNGARLAERVVAGGTPGVYRVVVRPYAGTTGGGFSLSLRPADDRTIGVPDEVATAIAESGDPSVFQFAAPDGEQLVVELASDPDTGVYMELADADGEPIAATPSGDGTNTTEYAVVGGGSGYRVVVNGPPSATFTLSTRPIEVLQLEVGDEVEGTIDIAGDLAAFEFGAPEGEQIIVEANLGDQVVMDVTDADGRLVATEFSNTDTTQYAVVRGGEGRYRAVVRGPRSTRFTVSIRRAEVFEVEVGEELDANIADELAVLEFEASSDQVLAVVADAEDGQEMTVKVTEPAGVVLYGFGSPASAVVSGGQVGRYQAVVSSSESNVAFTAMVRPVDVTRLNLGDTATATLEADGIAVFDIDVPTDEPVIVDATPAGDLQLSAEVSDPNGLAEWSESAMDGETASVVSSGQVNGRYRAVVRAESGSGEFTVVARPAEIVRLDVGETRSATIERSGDAAIFDFETAPGERALLGVVLGDALEADVEVFDPNGVGTYRYGAGGDEVSVLAGSDEGGVHRVIVSGFLSSGPVDVSLRSVDVVEATVGDVASVSTTGPDDVAVFELDVPDDHPLAISVTPTGDADLALEVTAPWGEAFSADEEESGQPETVHLTPDDATSSYVAVVRGSGGAEFTLAIEPVEVGALTIGEPLSGTISAPWEVAMFEFEATGDGPLTVRVEPDSSLDVELEVTDPNGGQVYLDDGADGDPETAHLDGVAGRYRVILRGYEASTGDYELTATSG